MIKSYDKDNKAVKLLKEAIDLFAEGETIHDYLSRNAHSEGLQGFKRWHRVQSAEDRNHRIELQHYAIDQFSMNIEVEYEIKELAPKSIMDHLEFYLEWEINVYEQIARISRELVDEFPYEAELVLKPLDGVTKEIQKIRRWLQDFKYTEEDKSYIKLCDKVLHDKVKKIEEK